MCRFYDADQQARLWGYIWSGTCPGSGSWARAPLLPRNDTPGVATASPERPDRTGDEHGRSSCLARSSARNPPTFRQAAWCGGSRMAWCLGSERGVGLDAVTSEYGPTSLRCRR